MKIDHRKLRLAATVVALLSVAVACWLYGIGQVERLTLEARERSVVKSCMEYGVAEGAWIDGAPYCLVHQQRSTMYAAMGGAEVWGLEIVTAVPLSEMGKLTGVMEGE